MKNDAGRYSVFGPLKADEKKLFEKTELPLGVKHTPLAVAIQVVNGTNYAFFCKSEPIVPKPVFFNALVIIHQPLDGGKPTVTDVKEVEII